MAADSLLTFSSLPAAPAAASPAPASPAPPIAASARPASPSSSGAGAAPQPAQGSADGSAAANGSGASSDSTRANSSARPDSGQPGNPAHDSRAGRMTAPASGASQASTAQTPAQPAATADDFSATLAQSLAATPADGAKTAGAASAKGGDASSGTSGSSGPPAKHSAADDPVSSALALLENALSGALAGALAGVPAAANPAASATSASGISSLNSRIGGGGSSAAALDTLLGHSLANDAKGTAATPAAGSPTAASPAATATATAAALTAAQLTSGSAVAAQHAKPDPTAMAVSSPVGSSAWTDELGAKVTWMAHQGIESASLQLSPEHLGPLQVTISVHDGQASVWFGAAQPDTRTALQQSLPQLRQLFAGQGLTLADAGVSRESPRGQDRQKSTRAAAAVTGVAAVDPGTSAGRAAMTGALGLVDTYA